MVRLDAAMLTDLHDEFSSRDSAVAFRREKVDEGMQSHMPGNVVVGGEFIGPKTRLETQATNIAAQSMIILSDWVQEALELRSWHEHSSTSGGLRTPLDGGSEDPLKSSLEGFRSAKYGMDRMAAGLGLLKQVLSDAKLITGVLRSGEAVDALAPWMQVLARWAELKLGIECSWRSMKSGEEVGNRVDVGDLYVENDHTRLMGTVLAQQAVMKIGFLEVLGMRSWEDSQAGSRSASIGVNGVTGGMSFGVNGGSSWRRVHRPVMTQVCFGEWDYTIGDFVIADGVIFTNSSHGVVKDLTIRSSANQIEEGESGFGLSGGLGVVDNVGVSIPDVRVADVGTKDRFVERASGIVMDAAGEHELVVEQDLRIHHGMLGFESVVQSECGLPRGRVMSQEGCCGVDDKGLWADGYGVASLGQGSLGSGSSSAGGTLGGGGASNDNLRLSLVVGGGITVTQEAEVHERSGLGVINLWLGTALSLVEELGKAVGQPRDFEGESSYQERLESSQDLEAEAQRVIAKILNDEGQDISSDQKAEALSDVRQMVENIGYLDRMAVGLERVSWEGSAVSAVNRGVTLKGSGSQEELKLKGAWDEGGKKYSILRHMADRNREVERLYVRFKMDHPWARMTLDFVGRLVSDTATLVKEATVFAGTLGLSHAYLGIDEGTRLRLEAPLREGLASVDREITYVTEEVFGERRSDLDTVVGGAVFMGHLFAFGNGLRAGEVAELPEQSPLIPVLQDYMDLLDKLKIANQTE